MKYPDESNTLSTKIIGLLYSGKDNFSVHLWESFPNGPEQSIL